MLADEGVIETELEREPWNDKSRPIYERLSLKRQAQKQGDISDTLLAQLASQRDALKESNEKEAIMRRRTTENFFSGMNIEEMEDQAPPARRASQIMGGN